MRLIDADVMLEELKDCHYCVCAACASPYSSVDCYGDFGFFDHTVLDSSEAEHCPFFYFDDTFPKT